MDGYLMSHVPYEMTEYYTHLPMMEDYEEYAENLSRPRLTKEQVDTLEAQFQAHPKPNSNVKRQLAAETNLSLPRVANWFQNRRAKAKQQRRQEEFERMQKEAKAKDGQTRIKEEESTDSQPSRDQRSPSRKNDGNSSPTRKSLTPTQASSVNKEALQTSGNSSGTRHKNHHKTGSDVTREKTFASLQRALSAAVAAREQYTQSPEGSISAGTLDIGFDMQNSMSAPSTTNTPQTSLTSAYSEWGSSRDSSIAWTPSQSPEEGYEFGSLNAVPFASEDHVPHMDNSPNADVAGSHSFGSLNSRSQQLWTAQLPGRPDVHASENMYGSLSFSSLQPPSAPSSRRPSASEELAETINGIGIHTSALGNSMESPMWRRPEKELDLAARRKRPRPAAIGTTHHRLVAGPSAVSPSTRLAGFGAPHHTIRHAKSSHALGSRYAGVRKFSAPQRSPLGFASFAEAAAGSEQKQKHRLHTSASVGNLAPPTPLTPEDLQQMLPTSAGDSQLSLNTHRLGDSQGLFPGTQSMQINVASPPETPLTMDMFSTIQYQGLAPPLSAPPQYASFTEYSPLSSEPLTAVSWAVSTPDTSTFPTSLQAHHQQQHQPPNYIYEQEDDDQQESKWAVSENGSSLYGSTKASVTPPASAMTASEEQDPTMTQFHIHEFPKQQEAHRNVAQQLATQVPKNYTFSNQTPSDF